MSYIWTFGDSFTFGHGCKSGQNYEYEKLYPFGDENLWPNLVSTHFQKDLINKSRPGFSNSGVVRELTKSLSDINKDDIVIIGKTDSFRFEVPSEYGMDSVVAEHDEDFTDKDKALIYYIKYIQVPFHESLQKELDESINSIQKILTKMGVLNFTWNYHHGINSDYFISIDLIDRIWNHTNSVINDPHFSWKGNLQFSNIIIDTINSLNENNSLY